MMTKEKQILWCGSILNHEGLKRFKGEAPSATQWSRGLINGLKSNDVNVISFSPIWDSLFPKGTLFPTDIKFLDSKYNQKAVKYLNAPLLRTWSVAINLKAKIVGHIKKLGKPLAIVNYNTYPHYIKALKAVKHVYPDILWINLVLDLDDPLKDNWNSFNEDIFTSDGCVFLSWWGYENAPVENKIHLDAGWDGPLPENKDNGERIFIYAGKLSDAGGIANIIEAIKLYPEPDVYFDFYGKGRHSGLEQLAGTDKRVRVKGFVSDEELDEACRYAKVFLSPRDVNFQGSRMVFPSKNLFYLKYRKPVIGQMLPGLSPEYENVMLLPSSDSPDSWSQAMFGAINMNEDEHNILANRIESFLNTKRWENQASRLINFINNAKK